MSKKNKKKQKLNARKVAKSQEEAQARKAEAGTLRGFRLEFTAPVHFGRGRLSDTGCTCDAGTLFSALFIEALQGEDKTDALLRAACSGDLLISDAFPYIGDTLYLPKPLIEDATTTSGDSTKDTLVRKSLKKLPFVPVDAYMDFLKGTINAERELERFKRLGRPYVLTKANLTHARKPEADPFHVGSFRFGEGNGIYFLARGKYAARRAFKTLLESLGYSGIGGERSSGYGRFKCSEIGNPLAGLGVQANLSDALGGRDILLSTAAPAEAELGEGLLEEARFELVRRGGFVQSTTHHLTPQKKRDLYLFSSGSVFANKFEGDVFDVNATESAHPVYRYARAMWMGDVIR